MPVHVLAIYQYNKCVSETYNCKTFFLFTLNYIGFNCTSQPWLIMPFSKRPFPPQPMN